MKHITIIVTLLFFVTLTLGCGSGAKVGGKVTYEDGEPVPAGTILFENGPHSYRGAIKPDGSYALGITKDSQKIPFGNYKVWFADMERWNREANQAEWLTAKEFTSVRTTPLTADIVSDGVKTFDFTVRPGNTVKHRVPRKSRAQQSDSEK